LPDATSWSSPRSYQGKLTIDKRWLAPPCRKGADAPLGEALRVHAVQCVWGRRTTPLTPHPQPQRGEGRELRQSMINDADSFAYQFTFHAPSTFIRPKVEVSVDESSWCCTTLIVVAFAL